MSLEEIINKSERDLKYAAFSAGVDKLHEDQLKVVTIAFFGTLAVIAVISIIIVLVKEAVI